MCGSATDFDFASFGGGTELLRDGEHTNAFWMLQKGMMYINPSTSLAYIQADTSPYQGCRSPCAGSMAWGMSRAYTRLRVGLACPTHCCEGFCGEAVGAWDIDTRSVPLSGMLPLWFKSLVVPS